MRLSTAQARLAAVCTKMSHVVGDLRDEDCDELVAVFGEVFKKNEARPDFHNMSLEELFMVSPVRAVSSKTKDKEEMEDEESPEVIDADAPAPVVKPTPVWFDQHKHSVVTKIVEVAANDDIIVWAKKSHDPRSKDRLVRLAPKNLDSLNGDAWNLMKQYFQIRKLPPTLVDTKFGKWARGMVPPKK